MVKSVVENFHSHIFNIGTQIVGFVQWLDIHHEACELYLLCYPHLISTSFIF